MTPIIQDKFADVKVWFSKLFESYENSLNGQKNQAIHDVRKTAINRLPALDFPTRRNEDWKYTSVNKVLKPQYAEGIPVAVSKEQIAPFLLEDLEVNLFVFVNGWLDEKLSHYQEEDGLTIKDMATALVSESSKAIVQPYLTHFSETDENPFVALNAAFARSGHFIHIAANKVIEKPVHFLYLAAPGATDSMINLQNIVVAERSSQFNLVESFYSLEEGESSYFNNVVNRFLLKENAIVDHYKIQQESGNGFQINNTEAEQYRDSTYSAYAVDLGGQIVRNNLSSILRAEGTMTHMKGLYLANGIQHIDNQTFMDHAFAHCNSNELYKGIITDKAKGVFNGKVIVRQDAQKTNAFQQNSNLVLSETAVMDSKPQLEIYADDVKCSHGATIGQLDEEAVFYLRSRGLDEDQARSLLQFAFLQEVLDGFPNEAIKQKAETLINIKFG